MGRFLDATGAAAKTAAEKAASGRFLKLAEDSTDSVPAESTGTPIPGVKQAKEAVSIAGKYWGPQFERAAKTPAGQMILKGFHALGRGASELTGAIAGGLADVSGGEYIGPIKASSESLLASQSSIARLREIQRKNLAARQSTKVSLDTTPPFVHYQPGSENVFGSDVLKANFPSMEPGPNEPFLANTVEELPGSVLGNIKRASNFATDVILDPTTYIHGPGLTKVGKTAEKVEAATRAGEKIGLKSLVAQDLAKSMGEKATPAMILKAKKGRFGKLADTFAEQVQSGQANVVSFKPPLTNVEIPLLPRGVATGVAKGAGAIGEAVGKLPLAKEFKRLFSVKTGNKEYDKLFQEFKDLRSFREGATLEQGQELAKRTAALAKKLKISPEELNKAITAGTEVKGKIAPTSAPNAPITSPYISKVPGMGGAPGDEGFAKQVDNELAGATERDAANAAGGRPPKFTQPIDFDTIANELKNDLDNMSDEEFKHEWGYDKEQGRIDLAGGDPEGGSNIRPAESFGPMKYKTTNISHIGKIRDAAQDALESGDTRKLDELISKTDPADYELIKSPWGLGAQGDAAIQDSIDRVKRGEAVMPDKLDQAANLDDLFANVDDGAAKEFYMQFDAELADKLKRPATKAAMRARWNEDITNFLKTNPNPTAEDVAQLAHDFISQNDGLDKELTSITNNIDNLLYDSRDSYPANLGQIHTELADKLNGFLSNFTPEEVRDYMDRVGDSGQSETEKAIRFLGMVADDIHDNPEALLKGADEWEPILGQDIGEQPLLNTFGFKNKITREEVGADFFEGREEEAIARVDKMIEDLRGQAPSEMEDMVNDINSIYPHILNRSDFPAEATKDPLKALEKLKRDHAKELKNVKRPDYIKANGAYANESARKLQQVVDIIQAKIDELKNRGESDFRKLPDIGGAYTDAKAALAKKVEGDLIAEKPTNPKDAKGYLGKWINYTKEFTGLGLSDDSKLTDPRFLRLIDHFNTVAGSNIFSSPTNQMAVKERVKSLIKWVVRDIYGMDINNSDSFIAAHSEFLQDLLQDTDRLALGNTTPRKYNPLMFANELVPNLKAMLNIKFSDLHPELDHQATTALADKALNNLYSGRPFKINGVIFGKDVDFLSHQDILGAMMARGAIGQEQPGESLFKKIQRAFPNLLSTSYIYTRQVKGFQGLGNLDNLSWTGVHTRTFLTAANASGIDAHRLIAKLQDRGLNIPEQVIRKARAFIGLAPLSQKLALKYEDAAANATNMAITRRLYSKVLRTLPGLTRDTSKWVDLRVKLHKFEDELVRTLGTTRPSLMTSDPVEGMKKLLGRVSTVYSEAVTGTYKNMPEDMSKLNPIAISIVRDIFGVEPNQLYNQKLLSKLNNRDPGSIYKDYLKWVKAHESGHRLLAPIQDDKFWSILPKEMREEYLQIWRQDKHVSAELLDRSDLDLGENFANANGFYLTLPKIMKEVAPKKYEFFRKLYTPGTHLEPAEMNSVQSLIDAVEQINPGLAAEMRQELPKYYEGTTTDFYSKPLSGDPALDSIIASIKEKNAKQLALEKTSGVKVTPLLSDTDYIAHAMTPEARDMVMERLNAAGKLPRAITAKEFSNKLANAVRRDFTTINKKKAEEFFNKGIIDKKQFREIKGEEGLAYLDRMLEKGQLTEQQYTQIVHSMTVQEVNEKAAAGQLKILGGKKVAEFFHEDPVFSTTIRGIRGERARTSAEFYQELQKRGLAVETKKAPIGWIEPNIDELKGYSVEPEVANHLNTYRKAINDPQAPTEFLRLFDQTQNLWKSWTLAIFPAYHTRNMVGNSWNNYLAGVRNPADYKLAADIQRRKYVTFADGLGHKWDTDTALLAAKKHGVIDRGWVGADIQRSIAEALDQPKLLTLSRRNTILQQGLKLGRSIENNARMAHFVAKLKGGYTAAEAAASVKKYLFDYDELTQFERNTMKRLFPFYTWTRKNIPLQIEHLVQRPGRYTILDKASHEIQTPDKPMEKYLPQWMLENYPQRIRFNKKSGDYEYFLLSSWLPAADIVKIFNIKDTAASMLTPIPKELLQQMFNYDVFLKRKIENVPGEKVNFLGKRVPARIAHAAKVIRLLNEADKLSKPDVDLSTKMLNLLTGKLYPFNEQQGIIQNKFSTDDEIQAIEQGIKAANKANDQAEVQRLYRLLQLKAQEY